uniref:Uncharacterized protein n=1 Tax=Romanomermis culicivorax TaxID=13658 RepID=A0A915J0D2_ROMCU
MTGAAALPFNLCGNEVAAASTTSIGCCDAASIICDDKFCLSAGQPERSNESSNITRCNAFWYNLSKCRNVSDVSICDESVTRLGAGAA